MLIEQMPIVIELLKATRLQIMQMTGANVKISIEEFPQDNVDQMLSSVADLVSTVFAVSIVAMKSEKRYRRNGLMDARHTFFYATHKVLGISSTRVGEYLGNKDHSTVLAGCKKIKGFLEVGDTVETQINKVLKDIPLCVSN